MEEEVWMNGVRSEVTLNAGLRGGSLRWREKDREKRESSLDLEREMLGVQRNGTKVILKVILKLDAAEEVRCGGGAAAAGTNRLRKDFVLEAATEEAAEVWSSAIQSCIDCLGRPKRLLILVNPYGGKRLAPTIFRNEVKPLLDAAGICYTMQETQYQRHAQEIAQNLDVKNYDGIICVSGDGLMVEVVNGLLHRGDWEDAIKMPLGIIPGGTSNGMVKSLLDAVGEKFSTLNAILSIICGHKQPLDVSTVKQGKDMFFSILMLTWGLIADVDIESEKFRWMGSARISIFVLLRILSLRKYYGRVHFVPAPGYDTHGHPSKDHDHDNDVTVGPGYHGPLVSFQSSEWRSIEGPFILVWLHNVPWGGADAMPAPYAKFSDGCLDVVMVKDCSKSNLLFLLTKLNNGGHVKSPYVIYLKVKAFRLEPGQRVNDPEKGGIIDSDGEVLARWNDTCQSGQQKDLMRYGPPIKLTIDQGLATIFSPLPP